MTVLLRCFCIALALIALVGLTPGYGIAQVEVSAVDEIFAAFQGTEGPGCAVGVSRDRKQILARAYGMANLEHDVINTPETVFEPGSVSKQFTAAATILLALDGELSLDDDVRKYIPELPDYGTTITIRHLLHHTSGLRDWGAIAQIGGWPRTTRVHTHKHVLDIASRQRSLNYTPGEYYSYTNTGYNLQAVLVERVSGMSFAEFSRRRIFEPLGMTRTEWRDDFTRVVKDRAVAYSPTRDGGFRMNMPFENVHGNGGLLTTVGDLLRFTHNLETGDVGGPEFIREMHTQGVLNSGDTIAYAAGLRVGQYKGVREVRHAGATAGYRGFLTRFPDQGVAVAVMCNAGNGNVTALAGRVADLYLGDALVEADPRVSTESTVKLPPRSLEARAGAYATVRGQPSSFTITWSGETLRSFGQTLTPLSETRFLVGQTGRSLEFDDAPDGARSGVTLTTGGRSLRFEPVAEFEPSAADLREYVGEYHSDEAEVTYRVEVEDGALVRVDRYGESARLQPAYPDTFAAPGVFYIFRRDGGRVTGFSLRLARVWDLRFRRLRGADAVRR